MTSPLLWGRADPSSARRNLTIHVAQAHQPPPPPVIGAVDVNGARASVQPKAIVNCGCGLKSVLI